MSAHNANRAKPTHGGQRRVKWKLEAEQNPADENSDDEEHSDGLATHLGELHSNILSAAHVVKQVQQEVIQLKQENAVLRKELNRSSRISNDQVLRASAGTLTGKAANGHSTAFAPEFLDRPETPTDLEPVIVLSSGTELESVAEDAPRHSETDAEEAPPVKIKSALKRQGTAPPNKASAVKDELQSKASQFGWLQGFDDMERIKSESSTASAMRVSAYEREKALRTMLFDPETVKQKMKQNICKQEWTVDRLYYKGGCAARIACSSAFEHIKLFAILANTLWIAVDTEHNQADVLLDADISFQIIENIFCLYFTVELLIRFAAFSNKRDCLQSGWFIFDFFLVVTMVFEDWVMTIVLLAKKDGAETTGAGVIKNAAILRILRLLRLARLGRAVKLVRQSPEVMIMVKAFAASTRCVMWTCVLLTCMMFFFGVCFTQMCKDTPLENEYFPSLTGSMHTLMIAGLFPDLQSISEAIKKAHFVYWAMFLVYLMMTTITVLNLLIGVLVEVAQASARVERDAMDVAYVKEVFVQTLSLGEVEDFTAIYVCKEEFADLLAEQDILKALTKVGIDVFGLIDLLDFIFIRGALGFAELLECVLQLRSSADVTVRDLVEVRKFLTHEITKMKAEFKEVTHGLHDARTKLTAMFETIRCRRSVEDLKVPGLAHTGGTETDTPKGFQKAFNRLRFEDV